MTNLQDLFHSLAQPGTGTANTRFAVVPIGDDLRHLIGKDQGGFPAILIDASHDGGTTPLRVELENLSVQPDLRCEVVFPDGQHRVGRYTLIRCSGDEELQGLFLRLVGAFLEQLSPSSERAELARVVLKLVDLFRVLGAPPRKSLQGLWAELFLIANSRKPIAVLEAWHADPDELYDFRQDHHCIDVKSSSQRTRMHAARLDQLYPPAGTIGVIVSVVAERAGGGVTIENLVDQVIERCATRGDLQLKLRTIVTETLGADWRLAARTRFDWDQAVQTCAMYRVEDVPRIPLTEIPAGITHVRFDFTLAEATSQEPTAIALLGGLLEAALPD